MPSIDNGVVRNVRFATDNVTDISPVRALVGLGKLICAGTITNNIANGKLSDLSPLQGMQLTVLHFPYTQVSDLLPPARNAADGFALW